MARIRRRAGAKSRSINSRNPNQPGSLICLILYRRLTLGAADEQVGQCEGAGKNSYRSLVVKALARLAADPWALDCIGIHGAQVL